MGYRQGEVQTDKGTNSCQTNRQTDKMVDKPKGSHTERQTNIKNRENKTSTEKLKDTKSGVQTKAVQTNRATDRATEGQTGRSTDNQEDRQMRLQTTKSRDKQKDRQTGIQTNRRTDKHKQVQALG